MLAKKISGTFKQNILCLSINYAMNIQPINNKQNYTAFSGHGGCERIIKNGRFNYITTETRFFRDYKTLKYAINYINEVFRDVKEKSFVVGACSTGEDIYSLKMLMHEAPVKILGFDIGKDTIKRARSGIFEFYIPHDKKAQKYTQFVEMNTFNDKFLVDECDNLSPEQVALKEEFNKLFKNIDSKNKMIYKLTEAFRKFLDIAYVEFDRKLYKLKSKDSNCTFVNGDILELNKILSTKRKNQLFAFKNAFYHIITNDEGAQRLSKPHSQTKPILDKIFQNINKSLDKNGLFIMGEEEHKQKSDVTIISKSLIDNGFIPIRTDSKYPSIWKKVKEVDYR